MRAIGCMVMAFCHRLPAAFGQGALQKGTSQETLQQLAPQETLQQLAPQETLQQGGLPLKLMFY